MEPLLKIAHEGGLGRYSKAQFLQSTPKIDKPITKDLRLAMTSSYFGQLWVIPVTFVVAGVMPFSGVALPSNPIEKQADSIDKPGLLLRS